MGEEGKGGLPTRYVKYQDFIILVAYFVLGNLMHELFWIIFTSHLLSTNPSPSEPLNAETCKVEIKSHFDRCGGKWILQTNACLYILTQLLCFVS